MGLTRRNDVSRENVDIGLDLSSRCGLILSSSRQSPLGLRTVSRVRPVSGWTFAAEGVATIHDLHATILHLLGIDHEKLTYRFGGRDFRLTDVHGRVVREVLA